MTSWVLTIAPEYPEHWDIAKEHMLWDMTTHRQIERGDVVYFWLARNDRFVGRAEIAEPAARLTGNEAVPWIDGGERDYKTRIRFSAVSDSVAGQIRWKQVQERTGITQGLNTIPRTDDSAAEAFLASLFEALDEVEAEFTDDHDAAEAVAASGEDTRRRTLATIRVRRGQSAFRSRLLSAYQRRCAVTGSSTEDVLEAAHIHPYRGDHTNIVQNGLLLRADIHLLFDLQQLTVVVDDEGYRVRVSPDVGEETYRSFDHQPLGVLPEDGRERPSIELLENHNAECRWLSPHIDLHR